MSEYRRICPKCHHGWLLKTKVPSADQVDESDIQMFSSMTTPVLSALGHAIQCEILRRKIPVKAPPVKVEDKQHSFNLLHKIITGKAAELTAKQVQQQAAKDLEARRSFYDYDEA